MKLTVLQWIDNEPYHKRTIYRYFYFLDDNFVFKNRAFREVNAETLLDCSLYVIGDRPDSIMEDYKREYKIWNFAPNRENQTVVLELDIGDINKIIKEGMIRKRTEQLEQDFTT